MLVPKDAKRGCIAAGIEGILVGAEYGTMPTLPVFLYKRFQTLHTEVTS
jgi:hypothetical protein